MERESCTFCQVVTDIFASAASFATPDQRAKHVKEKMAEYRKQISCDPKYICLPAIRKD